jgi:putative hydrolase of HD superfamily
MQPVLLNAGSDGRSWKEHQVRLSQILGRNETTHEGSEILWEYELGLINKNVESGNIMDDAEE